MNLQIPFSANLADIGSAIAGTSTINTIPPGSYQSDISSVHARIQIPVITIGQNIDDKCGIGGAIQYGNMNVLYNMSITATIIPACIITNSGSINALNFGSADTHAAPSVPNPSTTLSVQCTRTTPYTIALTPSNGNLTGAGAMSAGGSPDTVPYQLRKAAGVSAAVWGASGANRVSDTGTGATINHTIYGTVPSTNYRGGNYSDTVTVTIDY